MPLQGAPLFLALFHNAVEALQAMSKREGYQYEYAEIMKHVEINWEGVADNWPVVAIRYAGRVIPGNPVVGGETAYQRIRAMEALEIGWAIIDREDPLRGLLCVEQDIEKALFTDRKRGSTRVQTTKGETLEVGYIQDGSDIPVGAWAKQMYYVRTDHVSGRMDQQ